MRSINPLPGLKAFHVFFILTVLALLAFLLYWSGRHILHGHDGMNWGLAGCALGGLVVGIPYLVWFFKKIR